MSKYNKDRTISIRLSQLMLEALDARAILDEKDRTQVIREAINKYLDLPEESVENKLEILEKRQISQEKLIKKLSDNLQAEIKKTDFLEIRIEELNRVIAAFLERSQKK